MLGISADGFEEVERALTRTAGLQGFKTGIRASMQHLRSAVRQVPPVSRRPQPFTSDAQRRGFFARLRAGEIEVPYRRGISPNSEDMPNRWGVDIQDGGMTGVLGNTASYSPLVQGKRQAMYHRITGWKTVEQIGQEEAGTVFRLIGQSIARDLRSG